MRQDYFLDKDDIKVKKRKTSVWVTLRKVLVFFIATMSVAVIYYIIFALIFSTDEEQKLKNENRIYAEEYPELAKKEALLSDEWDYITVQQQSLASCDFETFIPYIDSIICIDY